jgi:ribonucleotide reductase beta subunit family protein with ferritin-like domain
MDPNNRLGNLQRAFDEATAHTASLIARIAEFRQQMSSEPPRRGESEPPRRGESEPPRRGESEPVEPARRGESEPQFHWAAGEESRLSLRPIRHEDIWAFRKRIEGLHWTAQEVDYTLDRADWTNRMSDDDRNFVRMQLAFFARIDVDVLDNLDENFGNEIDCLEARMVYAAQKDQECTHAESYALQIECVMSGEERETVLNAVRTMPIIAKMRAWVLRWFDPAIPIGERLVAFGAVEGVLFQASFAALQWLRERNILPGITSANSFIARDEGVHTDFSCLLVRRYLADRPSPQRVESIFRSVIGLIDEFVKESLPVRLIGMNADLMSQYVRFQADHVVVGMGYPAVFRATNPFQFMDKLTLNDVSKTNFFEARPTQYQTATKEGSVRFAIDNSADDD